MSLKQLIKNAIANNDFEELKQALKHLETEYEFSWKGKLEAKDIANEPTSKKLELIKEESKNLETTNNLYIEGDNLDGLKLLLPDYENKIKMIYIDPPYNSGSNFKTDYQDNFRLKTIPRRNKYTSSKECSRRFHTNWLNMIYPRLLLAQKLLKGDGLIFISIDDNEVFNLKTICDEIFDEENFITCCTRIAKRTSNKGTFFKSTKDYLLVYAKDLTKTKKFEIKQNLDINEYKYEDENGRYKKNGASLYQASLEARVNQRYYIECPDGSLVIPPGNVFPKEKKDGAYIKPLSNEDKCWRWSYETYLKNKNKLMFIKARKHCPLIDSEGNPSKWNIYDKVYYENKKDETLLPEDVIYDYPNSQGTKELKELDIPFSFAKPKGLIKHLMQIIGFNKDDIVLDFFSGSGTTAHACMELNASDNGNRQFIMIQKSEELDEKTEAYKKGLTTISKLGQTRIKKAGEKLVLDYPESIIDTGFKYLKIT